MPSLVQTLKSCNDENPNSTLSNVFIATLEEQINDMSKFQEMIESTLDLSLVDRGEFLIRAEFDDELKGTYLLYKNQGDAECASEAISLLSRSRALTPECCTLASCESKFRGEHYLMKFY